MDPDSSVLIETRLLYKNNATNIALKLGLRIIKGFINTFLKVICRVVRDSYALTLLITN